MITIIQGTPGSGKSSVATVDMLEFLEMGGVVACNYDLVPNWAYKLASMNLKVRWGRKDLNEVAKDLHSRAFRIGTSDTIMQLSQTLKTLETPMIKGNNGEGRGRLYIDEGQLLFNSRNYKDNYEFIEFFTQHRKLGWDVYIIAHTIEMIDKQIRGLIEYETRLRNMQKVKPLGLFPLSPVPLFLAITRYAGISAGRGEIAFRRCYTLRKKYSALYDSMEVFAFDKANVAVTHQGAFEIVIEDDEPKPKNINHLGASVYPEYYQRYTSSISRSASRRL